MRKRAGARRARSSRLVPTVWAASAVAAVVLVLGVSGTLSAWTSAIITNNTNTVATAAAVILQESNSAGTVSCLSSSGTGNSFICSTINKYGGYATPLVPGASSQTDVTFTDVGTSTTSTGFKLAPGACTQNPTASTTSIPPVNNLCTSGADLTVAVSCSPGTTYVAGSAWTDLVSTGVAPASLPTLTHAAGLVAGASATCRFTVALSTNASVLDQGVQVMQPLVWTLSQ